MSPTLRRLLTFGAMVTTGLVLVWLLQEDRTASRSLAYGTTEERGMEAVGLVHKETDTRVEVTVGELDFDVSRQVEVAPGVFEPRPAYRVHVLSGHPAPDGAFLVSRPTITFLELETGALRGELTADEGRFETDAAAGGKLRLDIGNIQAERFSLFGNVRGNIPLRAGGLAELEAERIEVEGSDVRAPGLVAWRRADLLLTGTDMHWDDAEGQLGYARDAVLTFIAPDTGEQAVLEAKGGLLWHLPADDAEGQGWGELFGPVTGEASDGSRLAGDSLVVGADARSLTLSGAALVEAPRGGRVWRATAPHITVSRHEDGRLALGQADGGVRLEDVADAGTWLEAEQITSVAGVLVAPGTVTFSHAGWITTGTDLRWEERTGRVELAADAVLTGDASAPPPLVGAALHSPSGLEWTLPGADGEPGFGRLRGPVTGTLADGSALGCDALAWEAAARRATLAGSALVRRAGPAGTDELTAGRVEITLDEAGEPAAVLCTEDVRVVRTPAEGPASSLRTARLELLADLLLAPDPVVIEHGPWRATGVGLRYDDLAGRFELLRDASLRLEGTESSDELLLDSDLGLTWWLPEDRTLGAAAGHGELAGPVRGRTADGGSLWADRALVRGEPRGIELFGAADIVWPGRGRIASEHLDIRVGPAGLLASSSEVVHWSRGTMEGSGRGLELDEGTGTLAFEQDVELVFRDGDGAFALAVSSAGPLRWWSPPGSSAPLLEGRGEFLEEVLGRDAAGGGFAADRLVIDGPAGRLELHGPSRLEHVGLLATLEASQGIRLERTADGELRRLEATGSVEGRRQVGDDLFELAGDELVVDRDQQRATLTGSTRVARRRGGQLLELVTEPAGSVVALLADEQLSHVTVDGRVTISTDEVRAESDSLTWDIPGDHVVLEGDCRFLGIGGWVNAPRAEVWPEAGRWYVPRSVIVVDNERR